MQWCVVIEDKNQSPAAIILRKLCSTYQKRLQINNLYSTALIQLKHFSMHIQNDKAHHGAYNAIFIFLGWLGRQDVYCLYLYDFEKNLA